MAYWKAAGLDHVQGFSFKKMTHLYSRLHKFLQEGVQSGNVQDCMTKDRTVLKQKYPAKGTQISNYCAIACLLIMCKLLAGIIGEKLYLHLKITGLPDNKQKQCRKRSRGTKDQLIIDIIEIKELPEKTE